VSGVIDQDFIDRLPLALNGYGKPLISLNAIVPYAVTVMEVFLDKLGIIEYNEYVCLLDFLEDF